MGVLRAGGADRDARVEIGQLTFMGVPGILEFRSLVDVTPEKAEKMRRHLLGLIRAGANLGCGAAPAVERPASRTPSMAARVVAFVVGYVIGLVVYAIVHAVVSPLA